MTEGTGKWCVPGVPHKGWECVDIDDLEKPCFVCEMCEVQVIRYVHHMAHTDYPDVLRTGCICAGYMEQDLVGARRREASFKSRRANWLRRHWRVSANGNEFLNTADGFNVVVFQKGALWHARFLDKATGYTRFSERHYVSPSAVKLAAFDAIIKYKRQICRGH
jgi:hypothetical protein